MDRVYVSDLGSAYDTVSSQIAVAALWSADADCFVGQLYVKRLDISFRVDSERFDA
jgi:hypothetical protein